MGIILRPYPYAGESGRMNAYSLSPKKNLSSIIQWVFVIFSGFFEPNGNMHGHFRETLDPILRLNVVSVILLMF